jgi:hypothetical protein
VANYEQGIPTRISYIRLSQEDRERVELEAARLGIPQTELWRRFLDLYFEVKSQASTDTTSASPTLTPRQAESLLQEASTSDAGNKEADKKFDFTGEKE